MKYADLHLHTHYSDGTFSPGQLVARAVAGDLAAIAVTDHDCVEAVDEAIAAAAGKLEIIPGLELTAGFNGSEIHVLGFLIDFKDSGFLKDLEVIRFARVERMKKILTKLDKMGIEIKFSELKDFAAPGTVGRLHLARLMRLRGYVPTVKGAFDDFLGEGRPAYEGKFKLSSEGAISLIKNAGGLAVLAHPYHLGHDEWLPEFFSQGLDGLEVYYNGQNPQITAHYERLAEKYNCLTTGGSDCHGLAKKQDFLGKAKVPYSLVERLKKAKRDASRTDVTGQSG